MKKSLLSAIIFIAIMWIIVIVFIYGVSYQSYDNIQHRYVEDVADLLSETLYYKIEAYFQEPVDVSVAMANTSFLKELLLDEHNMDEDEFEQIMIKYLSEYQQKYDYRSIWLCSTATQKMFDSRGLDRVIDLDSPLETWYNETLSDYKEYNLNLDVDKFVGGSSELALYVNCKIMHEGEVIAITGVAVSQTDLLNVLSIYEDEYNVKLTLVDSDQLLSMFDSDILKQVNNYSNRNEVFSFTIDEGNEEDFTIITHIPSIDWYLISDSNISEISHKIQQEILEQVIFEAIITFIVLLVIGIVFFIYNKRVTNKLVEIELENQHLVTKSIKDPATGLYNKSASREVINEVLMSSNRAQTHALIILDIDLFKQINDRYGHPIGDKIILEFANRITMQFNEECICGRIGGDEFIVLFTNVPDTMTLKFKLQRLVDTLHQDVILKDGTVCKVSSSIGAATFPLYGLEFEELYNNADKALYETKEKGRDGYTLYNTFSYGK
ncbi:MAG: hypothetical protein ATN35_03910 [Epulopiscium sp. Nele67-Bin004]|nr:MAG: hypothetical protein ATN35_03910 [Epulopiscium sp. Nele67-Bin004]